jgi:hypothetical protein
MKLSLVGIASIDGTNCHKEQLASNNCDEEGYTKGFKKVHASAKSETFLLFCCGFVTLSHRTATVRLFLVPL